MIKKHNVTFRQTKEDRELLVSIAKQTKLSISQLVRLAVHNTYHRN